MDFEDAFEVVGVGFRGLVGCIADADVAWYEMLGGWWRGARGRNQTLRPGIAGRVVEGGNSAGIGEQETVAS